MTYTTNAVNQYTIMSNPAESFTYDQDGNLKTDGTLTYTWDAGTLDATANAKRRSLRLAAPPPVVSRENRLTAVQAKRAGDPAAFTAAAHNSAGMRERPSRV
ncbi:MAG: hypothetical protein ACUVXJ_20065 [Phycisphaerae bacterium]